MNKKRVMLRVAYDGTRYHGWQIQPNANTIEAELNLHLSELLKEEIHVIGASRTDAGVHAMGNVAVFDTTARMPGEKMSYALNQRLPKDIKIQESKEVPLSFHPRHCDSEKTYEYRIYNSSFPMPIGRQYHFFTYYQMDIEKMRQAASYLVGEHDFKSFCSIKAEVETTVRHIYQIDILEQGCEIVLRIRGGGFLYNMVRIIAGTLMQVAQGFYEPEHVKEILEACDREMAGPTAPACGLTLMKIDFKDLV